MDSETAVHCGADFRQFLSRNVIHYEPRAKGMQVPYIDRRGALVRGIMHRIISQLKVEKIKMDIAVILDEATFCSNALLSVNGCTPYNALYGRVPNILPGIDQPDAMNEDRLNMPGTIRHTHRLREIAVSAMLDETAKVRAQRALQTRTLPAGQLEQFKCGDLVDFFRMPGTKDASGWIGPAKEIGRAHV